MVAMVVMVNSFTTISTLASKSSFRTRVKSKRKEPLLTNYNGAGFTSNTRSKSLVYRKAHENENESHSKDDGGGKRPRQYQHTLAILSMPYTSTDKIANEAILDQAIQHTRKLSVVLRCQNDDDRNAPSLSRLRRYVGEVYSTLWDTISRSDNQDDGTIKDDDGEFCDVVVYPQNLPNAAPESWIKDVAKDLDSVCSHDSICGWISSSAMGRGKQFQFSEGMGAGGLDAHVTAINADRKYRNLSPVVAIHVDPWPKGASDEWQERNNVLFLDDDSTDDEDVGQNSDSVSESNKESSSISDGGSDDSFSSEDDISSISMLGGARIPTGCLFQKVAVAGTFDGMHYGHRKLLTLAISSVSPRYGQLLIGVTVDEMLKHKSFSEDIPNLEERMKGVRDFVYRLAPGIKNRVRFIPIADEYGPPGTTEEGSNFDALVLSHETLDNGHKLNEYRTQTLGLEPLTLLCTRRTEPHGMSSTALRRRRRERILRREKAQSA
jgi:cytidyltransferase-like protein